MSTLARPFRGCLRDSGNLRSAWFAESVRKQKVVSLPLQRLTGPSSLGLCKRFGAHIGVGESVDGGNIQHDATVVYALEL